jgi:hypothetical protein
MSAVAHAQGKYVMHVASKYGETTFDTETVDSVYFDYEDGQQTTFTMESIKVFQEQQNMYPSDLFTQCLLCATEDLEDFQRTQKKLWKQL